MIRWKQCFSWLVLIIQITELILNRYDIAMFVNLGDIQNQIIFSRGMFNVGLFYKEHELFAGEKVSALWGSKDNFFLL